MKIDLRGKRALVTGGSSGIGRRLSRPWRRQARVALTYRTHSKGASDLVRSTKRRRGSAIVFEADVSDPEKVTALFQQIDEKLGGIDILINNAGMDGGRALSWEVDLAAWRRVIDVNLFGAFYCAREALKRLVPQKSGVVLGISSVHEEIAWSGYSAYAASKAALGMMTKTLAQEAAPHGVRVLAVAPGAIKTPINRSVWSDPRAMKDLRKKIPLDRIGTPEEIAGLVVVFVSDVASYVTGRTFFIDGGMTDYPDFARGG